MMMPKQLKPKFQKAGTKGKAKRPKSAGKQKPQAQNFLTNEQWQQ